MNTEYLLISTVDYSPPCFIYKPELLPADIRRSVFALFTDTFETFSSRFGHLMDKVAGIVVTPEGEYIFEQKGQLLWHMGISSSALPGLESLIISQLVLIHRLQNELREKQKISIKLERSSSDLATISDYFNIVYEKAVNDFERQNRWTITALTQLIKFTAQEVEKINTDDFPDMVVDFLLSEFFGYTGAAMMQYNLAREEWIMLSRKGNLSNQPFLEMSARKETLWDEGTELYIPFSVSELPYLIVVSNAKPFERFSDYERSFFKLFCVLISSTYKMKKLAREVEEKIVEINNIRTTSRLIRGLREETFTLSDVAAELYSVLSLDAIVLALPSGDGIQIIFSQGVTGCSTWHEFLKAAVNEKEQGWEIFMFSSDQNFDRGALGCKFNYKNPSFFAIQKRVIEHVVPQVGLVLNEKKYQIESITDPLTKLYNRRYIKRIIRDRLNLLRLDPSYSMSLCMLDIDHFKNINDTYGHITGDEVLKMVSENILSRIRKTDVAARYGGEEFIIIVSAGINDTLCFAERVRQRIEEAFITINGKRISVTVSIGVTSVFRHCQTCEQIIAAADDNLYKAKQQGRNRVVTNYDVK